MCARRDGKKKGFRAQRVPELLAHVCMCIGVHGRSKNITEGRILYGEIDGDEEFRDFLFRANRLLMCETGVQ